MKSLTIFHRSLFLLVFLSCLFSNITFGQSSSDTVKSSISQDDVKNKAGIKTPDDLVNGFEQLEKEQNTKSNSVSGSLNEGLKDSRLDSVKLDAWKSYYNYMTHGYRHRSNVFTWQLLSSVIIFCMVIFLVLSGIYFAWLQFKLAMKVKENGDGTGSENLTTELNMSSKEIKVSSPVLGVIILIISLAFFYLYLVYVYPINELF
ncbi:MAG: hypothetical protein JZU47_09950 [Prolixibacteraceae bacterium]|nr:hypothetical protein [Prolixibacteraceae bacterium]